MDENCWRVTFLDDEINNVEHAAELFELKYADALRNEHRKSFNALLRVSNVAVWV